MRVRPLAPENAEEIELVARRMRATLMEVVGEEEGGGMYDMDWLRARVRQHLPDGELDGAVLLAEDEHGSIAGHTIVRVETEEDGGRFGLFSTFYVDPKTRRRGVARSLVEHGEAWMRRRGLDHARTATAAGNDKLIQLCARFGYAIELHQDGMVLLGRSLTNP